MAEQKKIKAVEQKNAAVVRKGKKIVAYFTGLTYVTFFLRGAPLGSPKTPNSLAPPPPRQ